VATTFKSCQRRDHAGRALLVPRYTRLHLVKPVSGFTLIELMIVILILAILVGVAVAVATYARTKAWDSVAKSNDRVGNTAMQNLWLDFSGRTPVGAIPTQRYTRYYDGNAIWAQSMSNYETKMSWVDVRRTGTAYGRKALSNPTPGAAAPTTTTGARSTARSESTGDTATARPGPTPPPPGTAPTAR